MQDNYRLVLLAKDDGLIVIVDIFEGPWVFIEGVIRKALPKRNDFFKFEVEQLDA